MEIGVGLPNTLTIPGTSIVDWARRAEERGFHAVATLDRVVYPSFDSLTALAAAAGATSRIGLFTDILLTPVYPPVWLAKATASLDALSGGRLTLGLGVGGRPDDFAAMDRRFERRGKLMDETLDLLHRSWASEPVTGDDLPVGPPPANGNRISVLIGGSGEPALRRTVAYGEGWTVGGASPAQAAPLVEQVHARWREAGREGTPRIAALGYFGLGDEESSKAALRRYYGSFLGDLAEMVVNNTLRTPEALRARVREFADVGVTEFALMPTVASVDEVDRLADAVL